MVDSGFSVDLLNRLSEWADARQITVDTLVTQLLDQAAPPSNSTLFQRFFDHSTNLVAIAGMDGFFKRVNPAFHAFGYTNEELLTIPFLEFLHPDDRMGAAAEVAKIQTGIPTIDFEARFQQKSGAYCWLAWTSIPIPEDGTILATAIDITSHRESVAALRESEGRLAGIIDAAMDAIITVDEKQHIIVFNRAAEIMFHYSASDAIGQSVSRFIPQRFQHTHERHVERFSMTGVTNRSITSPGELMGVRADGDEFPIEATISQTTIMGERLYTVILRDITERKQAETERQASEAFFRNVAQTIPANLSITRLSDQRVLFANDLAAAAIGLTSEAAIGTIPLDASDLSEQTAILNELLTQGAALNQEMSVTLADGRKTWQLVSMRLVPYEGESAVLAVSVDITERKETELALARMGAIVDNSYDAIWSRSLDGRVTSWNAAAERIFGYTAAEIVGQPVRQLFPAESQNEYQIIQQRIEAGEPLPNYETVRVGKDGRRVDVALTVSPLRDLTGNIVGASVIAQDISQKKQSETLREELAKERELSDLKTRFTSMVSHEFRTPLATIRSSSDLLKRYSNRLSEERKQEQLESIQKEVQHLVALMDDILLIGKATVDGLNFQPSALDVISYCRELVDEVQQSVEHHAVVFEPLKPHCMLYLDAKLVRSIVVNLLTNAVKYSPEGRDVEFAIVCDARQVVLTVRDHGIGIPRQDQQHLFEMFHRATNVGAIQGTGIGLAIVKRAVEAHQGRIDFESTENVGTTFTVTLPSAQLA